MSDEKDVKPIPDDMPVTVDAPEAPGEIEEVSYGNYC